MDVESEQGRNRFELRGNEFNPRLSVERVEGWQPGVMMGGVIIALLVLMLFGQVIVLVKTGDLIAVTSDHANSADVRWSSVERSLGNDYEKVGSMVIDNSNNVADKVMAHVDLVCRP